MNEMKELRKLYESTEIPPELFDIVNKALPQTENRTRENDQKRIRKQGELKMNETRRQTAEHAGKNETSGNRKKLLRNITAAAAAFAVMFGAFGLGVSTNEAFADSVSGMPILGSLARVLLGEHVDEADNVIRINMKLPKVAGLTDPAVAERINKEIESKMTDVVNEAKQRTAENKEAWLKTGGTEKDYMLPEVTVDYEVKAITDKALSFVVSKTETSASAYYDMYYYNIDLKTNKEITLKELLGDGYIAIANEQIKDQIKERLKDPNNFYFNGEEGVEGFSTISKDQSFYVNKDGNPVIVFNKLEIAPAGMGIQEFTITK